MSANSAAEVLAAAPEVEPADVVEPDALAPHKALVEEAIRKATAGDPGAPFEAPVLDALRQLHDEAPAEYIRFRARLKAANREVLVTELDRHVKGGGGAEEPESVADALVGLVQGAAELFHDESRAAYASFQNGTHRETWPLDSSGFREWLGARYYRETGRAPADAAMGAALNALAGVAKFDGPEAKVWLRVAEHEGRFFLDLADDEWRAVEVSAQGWQVLDHPPVRFRRPPTMQALPAPTPGGDLDRLWSTANIPEADRPLVLALLLESLRPATPKPVLELGGEQGSGKSDAQARLRCLIDPSAVPLRAAPKAVEDLYVAAANNWLVSLNNLSHLSSPQQDALCTLSTGGGFAARTLYTNAEESVVEAKRPVFMNGISTLATAQDLVDRTIRLELPSIEAERRQAAELAAQFEADRPAILGGLLDLFAATLRELPHVSLPPKLPRMADFAVLGEAMFRALGRRGSFISLYTARREKAALLALEASPAAGAVLAYVGRSVGAVAWAGTIKGLFEAVAPLKQEAEGWPKSARGFADALRRAAPGLRRPACW
ncbi:MAG: hypothetical protein ACYDA8_02150 [Deferrisomatales bacterium]